jgi:glycosyltransferase involved in cell wall biosynthesis
MAVAVRQVSERLVALGHDVTIATGQHPKRYIASQNGVNIAEFMVSGNWAKGMHGDVGAYREFVCSGDFDLVVNFAAQQWSTDALLDCLDRIPSALIMVPTGFSGLLWNEYRNYYECMPDWLRQYDRLVFLGRECRDSLFAEECGLSHGTIIPNGASAEEFMVDADGDIREQLGIGPDHTLILLVGSHTGMKGHAEAIRIFSESGLRMATLLIVGDGMSERCGLECLHRQRRFKFSPRQFLSGKRLLLAELTRQQTVAVFKAADIFLFPSMIECSPIVLFECLASKTPFLATDVGNVREIVGWTSAGGILPGIRDDEGLFHADIQGSAHSLTELWRDRERRDAMMEAGFSAWREKFTWDKIAGEYEQLYSSLLT